MIPVPGVALANTALAALVSIPTTSPRITPISVPGAFSMATVVPSSTLLATVVPVTVSAFGAMVAVALAVVLASV